MSAHTASVTLEQTLCDCFTALTQSPDYGVTWATLAAPLWVTNVATAYRNLLAHRSSPSETSAWSKFMALLGHPSIDVPKGAWPTVEADLIARLSPALDAGSTAMFNTPPPKDPKGRSPSPPVLIDLQPLPWSWFKKVDLGSDDKGYKLFVNMQHACVFATMGHQHGELAKDARQKEVDKRWGFSTKWIKKAESDVLTKRGNLTTKVENFFVKPHGPAANGWEMKDICKASHKQAAEALHEEVRKLSGLYTRQCSDLIKMKEVAEEPRRIKTFDIVKKPQAPANILKCELVRNPGTLVASPTVTYPRHIGHITYCLMPSSHARDRSPRCTAYATPGAISASRARTRTCSSSLRRRCHAGRSSLRR